MGGLGRLGLTRLPLRLRGRLRGRLVQMQQVIRPHTRGPRLHHLRPL